MATQISRAENRLAEKTALLCPSCGWPVGSAPLEMMGASSLFACANCDLHFWHPCALQDATWHEAVYQGRDASLPPLEPGHRFFLADPHAPRGGTLLDVGCGVGNFLQAARGAGYEVTGIELNRNAVRFAQERLGLREVYPLALEQFTHKFPGRKFDVVTFFEVLEHQDRPREFLEQIRLRLTPGGHVALSVPNRNRWQKGRETLDYPPNHLTRWSPRALVNFLSAVGLEVLSLREEPLGVKRAASVMSSGLRTGLAQKIAGENPPTPSDLAGLEPQALEAAIERVRSRRHRLSARLAQMKNYALIPAALAALPYLRWRKYRGLYLYCLAKQKE